MASQDSTSTACFSRQHEVTALPLPPRSTTSRIFMPVACKALEPWGLLPNTVIFKINNSVWLVGLHGRQCLRSSSAGDEPFGMDTRPKYPAAASIRW